MPSFPKRERPPDSEKPKVRHQGALTCGSLPTTSSTHIHRHTHTHICAPCSFVAFWKDGGSLHTTQGPHPPGGARPSKGPGSSRHAPATSASPRAQPDTSAADASILRSGGFNLARPYQSRVTCAATPPPPHQDRRRKEKRGIPVGALRLWGGLCVERIVLFLVVDRKPGSFGPLPTGKVPFPLPGPSLVPPPGLGTG